MRDDAQPQNPEEYDSSVGVEIKYRTQIRQCNIVRGVHTDRMQKTMSDVEAGEVKAETRKSWAMLCYI